MHELRSPELAEQGTGALGPWRVSWTARPYAGEAPGGDRFVLTQRPAGALCFALADAAGHGARGGALWERHAKRFAQLWKTFVAGGALEEFVDPLDASLLESNDSLCLTVGCWQPDGALEFATCGYGTHALVRADQRPWWDEAERLFGLKLGWLGPARRNALPRGLVRNTLANVERVILLSDGLLEDDHRHPDATMASLVATNVRCVSLPFEEVLPAVLELTPTPVADDLTAVVLELGQASSG